jgi:hypothetical protein
VIDAGKQISSNFSVVDVLKLRRSVAGFPLRQSGFAPRSGHVEFVVGRVAVGQVFSQDFGFFVLSILIPPSAPHSSSSGSGTVGQLMANVHHTPFQETKKKKTSGGR